MIIAPTNLKVGVSLLTIAGVVHLYSEYGDSVSFLVGVLLPLMLCAGGGAAIVHGFWCETDGANTELPETSECDIDEF